MSAKSAYRPVGKFWEDAKKSYVSHDINLYQAMSKERSVLESGLMTAYSTGRPVEAVNKKIKQAITADKATVKPAKVAPPVKAVKKTANTKGFLAAVGRKNKAAEKALVESYNKGLAAVAKGSSTEKAFSDYMTKVEKVGASGYGATKADKKLIQEYVASKKKELADAELSYKKKVAEHKKKVVKEKKTLPAKKTGVKNSIKTSADGPRIKRSSNDLNALYKKMSSTMKKNVDIVASKKAGNIILKEGASSFLKKSLIKLLK